jgi:hypothetical protein
MDELELNLWLQALQIQGFIKEWHWTLHVEPGEPAAVCYQIDGRAYSQDGAVKLIRDFEAPAAS